LGTPWWQLDTSRRPGEPLTRDYGKSEEGAMATLGIVVGWIACIGAVGFAVVMMLVG
jgi:hypothetical protein